MISISPASGYTGPGDGLLHVRDTPRRRRSMVPMQSAVHAGRKSWLHVCCMEPLHWRRNHQDRGHHEKLSVPTTQGALCNPPHQFLSNCLCSIVQAISAGKACTRALQATQNQPSRNRQPHRIFHSVSRSSRGILHCSRPNGNVGWLSGWLQLSTK